MDLRVFFLESILSKVDNIFNPKPRETMFKLMQAQTKNFG